MGRIPPSPPPRDTGRLRASIPPGATSAQVFHVNCRNCGAPPRSGEGSCRFCGTQAAPPFFGGARAGGMTSLLSTPTPGRVGGV